MAHPEDNFPTMGPAEAAAMKRLYPSDGFHPEPSLYGQAMSFPGGTVVKARPTKAQLEDNALAWLAMARTQLGSVTYWAEQVDRKHETLATLKVLASHLEHVRRALTEAELAK